MPSENFRIDLRNYNIFLWVMVALFVVLVVPTFMRFYSGNDALIGSEPYYHFTAARELLRKGSFDFISPPIGVRDMAFNDRFFVFSPYHYLLVYFSQFFSLMTVSRIVPFVLGILSVFLFNLILKRFFEEDYKRHVVLLVLVLNPAFIYTFTVSNQHSAAIAFSLAGFYFFMRQGRFSLVFSLAFFGVVSLFSLFNALLVILLLFAYILSRHEFQSRFVVSVLFLALFSLAKRLSFFYNYSFAPDVNFVGNLLSDLGGLIGFGMFTVVLAVYGVCSWWKEKGYFIYFFVISLVLMMSLYFIGNVANMYLMFFMAVAAGTGFIMLYDSKWNVVAVKNLTLLILVCGILFSSASFMTRLASMDPDPSAVESLVWLSDHAFKDEFVLSHYSNGYLISAISRNPVIADSFINSEYDQRFLYKVQDSIFYSSKLNTVKPLLAAYGVKYVYVTPEMRSGQVWSRPDEGLLFLFTSQSTFRKVYDKDGYEIWDVLNTTVSS